MLHEKLFSPHVLDYIILTILKPKFLIPIIIKHYSLFPELMKRLSKLNTIYYTWTITLNYSK